MLRTLKASSACSQKILSTNISTYITNVDLVDASQNMNFDKNKMTQRYIKKRRHDDLKY
jgi:hypothetical protein